ncbi:MAG: TetR/AcrR family transcriptional regulator [Rhizobiaceae bacterium]|nr:TetR/AcrR family transcriptional regulator [Rhizobiaceae bacterium]MCV0407247.1 TetR/AcrR family transcriptional regulator [Rhizobiaceae bacterium]
MASEVEVRAEMLGPSTKDEIKRVTVGLLLRHGYQGLRFRDIADMLGITRANIHHHYGNKQNLCEEVIAGYVEATLTNWAANWTGPGTLAEKIEGMMEANRARYLAFNPTGRTANPWSLIGRMRLERDLIGPRARQALIDFGVTLDRLVLHGVSQAIEKGELSPNAPREAIALQLVAVADSAGFITQDGGDFRRLEQLYRSISLIVHHAYGVRKGL